MAISNTEVLIQETVAFAKTGNRPLAEYNFRKVMQECDDVIEDPAIWLMMAWLAPSPQAMSQVLERFLAIDPENELAQQGLRWSRGIANLDVDPNCGNESEAGPISRDRPNWDFGRTSLDPLDMGNVTHSLDTVDSVVFAVQETFGSPASETLNYDLDASVSEFGYVPLEDPTTDEEYERLFATQESMTTQHTVASVVEPLSAPLRDGEIRTQGTAESLGSGTLDPFIRMPQLGQEQADSLWIGDLLPIDSISDTEVSQANPEISQVETPELELEIPVATAAALPEAEAEGVGHVADVISVCRATDRVDHDGDSCSDQQSGDVSTIAVTQLPDHDGFQNLDPEEARYATVTALDEPGGREAELDQSTHQDIAEQEAISDDATVDQTVSDALSNFLPGNQESNSDSGILLKGDKPRDANGHRKPMGPSILVVDDSPTVRKLLTMMLSQGGYEVSSAVDGLDAVQSIAAHVPQLIITDINMPRLDGYKLCKLVTRNARTRHIPVVMISAGIIDRLRGKLAGCSGYLAKPITPGSLNAVVEFALQESSVR
ncbi:MAG: response regulator receiver protein [Planctomycetaceae bacterium]|nr:response regulator receiver protein [Planctomycetaceae bacterium]